MASSLAATRVGARIRISDCLACAARNAAARSKSLELERDRRSERAPTTNYIGNLVNERWEESIPRLFAWRLLLSSLARRIWLEDRCGAWREPSRTHRRHRSAGPNPRKPGP